MKKITILILSLLISVALLFLNEEDSEKNFITTVLNSEFELSVNQTVELSDNSFKIKFLKVLEDSRCPINTQCPWQGKVTVLLTTQGEDVNLTLGPSFEESTKKINDYYVELIDVKPTPQTFKKIREQDYVITLIIKNSNNNKPSELPTFENLSLYSKNSPFNKRIEPNPEIDPQSDQMIKKLVSSGQLLLQVKKYSAPVYFADENTPRTNVELTCGPVWELGVSVMKNVPIPEWAEPVFDGEPPIIGCGEDSDQDNHMIILDLTTRCEYDFWQARKENDKWVASWGNSISMDSDGVFPNGLSARGSGFAFLGGVIWPDELLKGRINHALAFSYPFPRSGGPVPPATDSDGVISDDDAIPEGAVLQLNPDLDLNELNLTPYEETIAKALQEYGMILVDGGGDQDVGLQAINPASASKNLYEGVLPDEDWVYLPNIPLKQLRVLKLPPQNTEWQNNLKLSSNNCAQFS